MKKSKFLSTLGIATIISVSLQSCNSLEKLQNHSELIGLRKVSQTRTNISKRAIDFESNNSSNSTSSFLGVAAFDDFPDEFDLEKSALLTDMAKLLAGMRISNTQLKHLKQTSSWQKHRRFLNNAWTKLEANQLSPIRQWQETELQKIDSSIHPVFYPFSNANFAQVYSLFPQSREFILTGIEPVGFIPNLAEIKTAKLETKLQQVRSYLYAILPLDYFRTKDIQNQQTQEALPALYVFLARTNNRIVDVEYVGIDRNGNIQPKQSGMGSGVKITFVTPGNSDSRLLYYFSADLSNKGIKAKPELAKFLRQYDNKITYIQGASYLMHFDSFSLIKDLILSQSSYLLQDDSGLPLSAFESERWDVTFYGNYTQPSPMFGDRYQPKLWQIYTSKPNIKPLTFATGYRLQLDRSNLMLAKIKNKVESELETPTPEARNEFVK